MYVEIIANRSSPPAILLRESRREGKKIHKKTLSNISHWPMRKVRALRAVLKDEPLVNPDDIFECRRALPHGHVEIILAMMRKLGLPRLIDRKASPERSRVLALIAQRLLEPASKLASTRLWHDTTLAGELDVTDSDCNDLYAAMDWMIERQPAIERRFARRHLCEKGHALYDVSSSYYEGHSCPLMRFGYSRDGKRGRPIVVYGLMTDSAGCPISIEAWPGNTADPATVPAQVEKLRDSFGLQQVVLVGDRGMLTDTTIDVLRRYPGLGWISALDFNGVRRLADVLQPSLFDDRNLAEIRNDAFPGERLIVCHNPQLAERRRRKREDLLTATEERLEKIVAEVGRRTKKPLTKTEIAKKLGRVENKFKMAKHFVYEIEDGHFSYARCPDSIEKEAAFDGIYVIRTDQTDLSDENVVRSYKALTRVERAFRSMKTIDLRIRPIRHRLEQRVRAHLLLCMLAYYVEWHLRQVLEPLLFHDEDLHQDRETRDPVVPAKASASAKRKKCDRTTPDGLPLHSFSTLLMHLGTRVRLCCYMRDDPENTSFERVTDPTPIQERVLELVEMCPFTYS